jgi:hypothetical protein
MDGDGGDELPLEKNECQRMLYVPFDGSPPILILCASPLFHRLYPSPLLLPSASAVTVVVAVSIAVPIMH